eukprot:gene18496-24994_t
MACTAGPCTAIRAGPTPSWFQLADSMQHQLARNNLHSNPFRYCSPKFSMASLAYAGSDLLALQGNCKKDSDGYKDEFLLQYRHYQALLDIFRLKPSKESKEFGDLVAFVAQVCKCYPAETVGFAEQVMGLLDSHYADLDGSLRRSMVQGLILLHNRHQLDPLTVLPLFFRLFRCQDKQLRHLLYKHIISDIKNANKKHRNERLNRSLQNFMYSVIGDDNEAAAKKSLAVCTELWRRHVWRDARTVNVIASAAHHKSPRIMVAVMKFFLGQDQEENAGSDDEDGGNKGPPDDDNYKASMPTKQEVYNTTKKGTRSSKKKKMHKLKRVVEKVKKQERRGNESHTESFAALHLLHDPQSFAEKLFSRLQTSPEKFETRLDMISIISRVVGVHKLVLLNFYPYLQKYIAPHQRDVTVILAALAMACHDLVPPESLTPVLKQLVDQFINDRARPEVMTIGLKTVREMCLRCPLVMNEDLLQDLALYKKYRDKQVSSAAKGLIGLFRDLNPILLAKKDRGRGADLESKPKGYGEMLVHTRVAGADLLEQAEALGQEVEDDEVRVDSSDSDDDMGAAPDFSDDEEEGEGEGDEEMGEGESEDSEHYTSDEDEDGEDEDGEDEEEEEEEEPAEPPAKRQKLPQQKESLSALKKRLIAARLKQKAKVEAEAAEAARARAESLGPTVPIEADRFLTEEDFDRIKRLKQKALVEGAMAKHGLTSTASKAKKRRALEAAEEEAEEALALEKQKLHSDQRIAPSDLQGRHKYRKDKEERMASVLAGREGRSFGASTGMKKNKEGGLTEREKQRKKAMPIAARLSQLKTRATTARIKATHHKNFKGKTA